MTARPTLFHEATAQAVAMLSAELPRLDSDLTIVRDYMGRINLLVEGSEDTSRPERRKMFTDLATRLSTVLGAYTAPGGVVVFYRADMFMDGDPELDADARVIGVAGGRRLLLLDRQITGQDWMRSGLMRTTQNLRFTFFAIKGGVGRSTAIAVWAWHLAKQGKRVLLFDLDLESPGLSSTLLPLESLPDFGVVDWFVEQGVGQQAEVEQDMFALSPISRKLAGEVRVVPAYGKRTGEYLPKLSRCYSEQSGPEEQSWAGRLHCMVETLERLYAPDVVIFDSRAGIHDIAAAVVTRFDAESLLFAIDSPQTWQAYALLFESWKQNPQHLQTFLDRLKLVGAMLPETERDLHRERMSMHAWDTFRENLYDEDVRGELEAFSFDRTDDSAPHFPWTIHWHRALQSFNPSESNDWKEEDIVSTTFGDFLKQMDERMNTLLNKEP